MKLSKYVNSVSMEEFEMHVGLVQEALQRSGIKLSPGAEAGHMQSRQAVPRLHVHQSKV